MSLIESLVAAAVFTASTLAVAEMERHLRLGGDIARERSEALRLGSEEIERWRAFTVVDASSAPLSYGSIADGVRVVEIATEPSNHASYRIERRVDDASRGEAKAVSVAVRWSDRAGMPHDVVLHSVIAGVAPLYAGALGLGAGAIDDAPRAVSGRAPGVPATARSIGRGRSAWKPTENGAAAFVFDDASGAVVERCDGVATTTRTRDLSERDLAGCVAGHGLLVSGTIRFTSASPPVASQASDSPWSTGLAVSLERSDATTTPPTCFSEARKTVRYTDATGLHLADVALDTLPASRDVTRWDDTGDRFIAWHCVVAPRADGTWSGRASLVADGWAIGTTAAAKRVCRYVGGGPNDANIAHPADYRDVDGALVAQDFLVVRGSERCPPGATVQHQP